MRGGRNRARVGRWGGKGLAREDVRNVKMGRVRTWSIALAIAGRCRRFGLQDLQKMQFSMGAGNLNTSCEFGGRESRVEVERGG